MALIEMFSFVFLQYEQKPKDQPTLRKAYNMKVEKPRWKKWEKKSENRDNSRNRIETVIATTDD